MPPARPSGASLGRRHSHSDPSSTAPALEPGPRTPPRLAGSVLGTETGLKPWPSCDLGRVPGCGPQFPGPRDPEAGGLAGGAGSEASWRARVAGRTSGRPPRRLWGLEESVARPTPSPASTRLPTQLKPYSTPIPA